MTVHQEEGLLLVKLITKSKQGLSLVASVTALYWITSAQHNGKSFALPKSSNLRRDGLPCECLELVETYEGIFETSVTLEKCKHP